MPVFTTTLDVGPGQIDVQIEYEVTHRGSPARVHYDELDHPGEGAEVNVRKTLMLLPRCAGSVIEPWFLAWDWLHDAACEWADRNADTLAQATDINASERYLDASKGR